MVFPHCSLLSMSPIGSFRSQVRMEEREIGLSSSLEGELLSTF